MWWSSPRGCPPPSRKPGYRQFRPHRTHFPLRPSFRRSRRRPEQRPSRQLRRRAPPRSSSNRPSTGTSNAAAMLRPSPTRTGGYRSLRKTTWASPSRRWRWGSFYRPRPARTIPTVSCRTIRTPRSSSNSIRGSRWDVASIFKAKLISQVSWQQGLDDIMLSLGDEILKSENLSLVIIWRYAAIPIANLPKQIFL